MTSMSREIRPEASAPTNRSRMTAIATTVAAALKKPCSDAQPDEHLDRRRDRAQDRRHDVQRDADQDGRAPAEPVGQRADDELADRAADHHRGHRQLGGGRGRVQVARDVRQRRQVDVVRDGRQRAHHAEQQHVLRVGAVPARRRGVGAVGCRGVVTRRPWSVGRGRRCSAMRAGRRSGRRPWWHPSTARRIDSIRRSPHVSGAACEAGPMCGRYASFREDQALADEFAIATVADDVRLLPPSWNVAPTDGVRMVVERADKETGEITRQLRVARWGLVPSWAKDPTRRQPHDQRPRRDARGQAGLQAAVRHPPRAAARGRLLRVEEARARARPCKRKQPYYLHPGDGSRRRAGRAVRVLERPDAGPTTTRRAGS